MKPAAWSAQRESRLTLVVRIVQAMVWLSFAGVVVCMAIPAASAFMFCFIMFILAWMAWSILCERLARTLLNKPSNPTAVLTQWHQWPSYTAGMLCICGSHHTFSGKYFYPNPVDAGGGRYAFVCHCARGHYKLAAPPAE